MVRPRKQDALDVPRRAVEEAIRLIAERDSLDITMNDVAVAVGCKAPALYNHFRNKDALLRAAHDEGFHRLYGEKLAVAARTSGDAFRRLREGGLAYLGFALENPALYRLMFSPPPVEGLEGNPLSSDLGRRSLDFLAESVAACQAEGYLPGHDPRRVAFTLWSTVHGAASLILQDRSPAAAGEGEAVAAATVETVMSLVAATKRPPETG